jgi:hypothetical protein
LPANLLFCGIILVLFQHLPFFFPSRCICSIQLALIDWLTFNPSVRRRCGR